ncbi:MAG: GUN4 domain-containing protein [Cyanobacteria bacterium P01_G01_bin.54]
MPETIPPFDSPGRDDPDDLHAQQFRVGSRPAPRLCPICQRVQPEPQPQSQPDLPTRGSLCYHCDWPLEPELSLSIAQQVWLRQRWRQVEHQEDLCRRLAQQFTEQLRHWEAGAVGQPPAIQPPSLTADSAAMRLTLPIPPQRLDPQRLDYGPLQACLDAGDWRGADGQSAALLVAIAGRQRQGYLTPEDLANLPTETLLQIDHYWQVASDGRFGLGAQKQCHVALSGNRARIAQVWPHLARQLGWCHASELDHEFPALGQSKLGSEQGAIQWLTYDALQFAPDAPMGHLPVLGDGIVWFVGGWGGAFNGFAALMSRLP